MRTRWGRILLLSTALGVCAAAPGFAQTKPKTPAAKPAATTTPATTAKTPPKNPPVKTPGGNANMPPPPKAVDDVEDLGGDEPEAKAGAPSADFRKAKDLLDKERWSEAAVAFHNVLRNNTDDPGNTQHAQFYLAIALYHLEYYQSSYTYFLEIAKKPKHLDFEKTLGWLARLATQLPEPADIIGHLGKYTDEQVAATAKGDASLLAEINYLYARYKYRKQDWEKAMSLFKSVPESSKYYIQAQFFAGITSVRMHKIAPAKDAFTNILNNIGDHKSDLGDDWQRYVDLANLSLARTYYSAAIKSPSEGEFVPDPERITQAVVYWNAVEVSSEYWLDALFEESWAYFMASDYPHALGNIHTIESPYFPNSFYPEAEFLKAIIYFTNCQYENSKIIVAKFVKKYQPIFDGLKGILKNRCPGPDEDPETGEIPDLSPEDAKKCLSFLEDVKNKKAQELQGEKGSLLKPVVEGAFGDRDLLRNLQYIDQITAEQGRLKEAKAPIKGSALAGELASNLANAINDATSNAGALARGRFLRAVDDLDEHLGNVQTMLIDILAGERNELEKTGDAEKIKKIKEAQAATKGLGDVKADEEHYLWPFDGEYWRDELGFYRQRVVSICGGRQ